MLGAGSARLRAFGLANPLGDYGQGVRLLALTGFPRELAEAALAHVAGDATERAYRRGDALEKRRGLMEAWAAFCEPKAGSNVLSMTRPQAS
jgi:hypothetical protein